CLVRSWFRIFRYHLAEDFGNSLPASPVGYSQHSGSSARFRRKQGTLFCFCPYCLAPSSLCLWSQGGGNTAQSAIFPVRAFPSKWGQEVYEVIYRSITLNRYDCVESR